MDVTVGNAYNYVYIYMSRLSWDGIIRYEEIYAYVFKKKKYIYIYI